MVDGAGPGRGTVLGAAAHRTSPVRAFVAGSVVVLVVTAVLAPFGTDLPRSVPALVLLAPVIATGLLGGRLVAAGVALEAALSFAVVFLPPIGSPAVELGHDVVALGIFVVVAGALGIIIATVVSSERGRAAAERARVEALTEVDAQRSALLRSVSHDLRTPLASIRAVVSDLRTDLPFDEATRARLLDLVAGEAERLDRLVANLLSMSRIEAGAFLPDRDAVDVAELVDATTARLSTLLADREVQVVVPPDLPAVGGDFSQLDQVLTNLVENAARHGGVGPIRIEAAAAGEQVRITVADRGPGISPADRETVFEPFHSGGPAGSTGLGLAIARSVVEAHGGTIAVDGDFVDGTRIAVLLPTDRGHGAGDR